VTGWATLGLWGRLPTCGGLVTRLVAPVTNHEEVVRAVRKKSTNLGRRGHVVRVQSNHSRAAEGLGSAGFRRAVANGARNVVMTFSWPEIF